MTILEMQYKAANERLEASLEQRDAERSEMRKFLLRMRELLKDKASTRGLILLELEAEMIRQRIVW